MVPGYTKLIKKPMDLTTIKNKLQNKEYKYLSDFSEDFELMYKNCIKFNEKDSFFHLEAIRLDKFTKELIEDEELESDQKIKYKKEPQVETTKFQKNLLEILEILKEKDKEQIFHHPVPDFVEGIYYLIKKRIFGSNKGAHGFFHINQFCE
jgi:hypothetical protein